MAASFQHWLTPMSDTVLSRLLGRRAHHPDEFECAVRVVSGSIPGESAKWRYRRSAVDPFMPEVDVVTVTHGDVVLRLRFTGSGQPRNGNVRLHHRVWPAVELTSGARVEVAADAGEAVRLHVDA